MYANKYSGVKQQKAILIIVLLKVLDLSQTELATEIADLVCAAFFFAMQPFKYTKTSKTAERKIKKIITVGNIRFYRDNLILRHDQDIKSTDWVNITFEYQKKATEMNISACTYQINSLYAHSYCSQKL